MAIIKVSLLRILISAILFATVVEIVSSCNDITDPCDPRGDRFTECAGGQCKCADETDSIFLPTTQTCYLLAEKDCVVPTGGIPRKKCILNSQCIGEKCKCNLGLEPNVEDRCFIKYGNTCDIVRDLCDPATFLSCGLGSLCECRDPENTILDPDASCRLLADSQCSTGTTEQQCVYGAVCNAEGICECEPDFFKAENRVCMPRQLDHGASCVPGDIPECDPSKFLECNPSSGQCDCKADAFFDISTNRCFLFESSQCLPANTGGQLCAPNSECQNEVCKCLQGLEPNEENRCFVPYEKPCSFENDLCDPVSYLACGLHEICDCANREDTIYEQTDLTCRLLVDSKCTPGLQKCVPNSECVEGSVPGDFKCECEPDFFKAENRVCMPRLLDHGASCVPGAIPECDPSKFLECNPSSGQCDCKADAFFDASTSSCFLLESSLCSPANTGGQLCAPNSECQNGVCICLQGLEANEERRCFLPYAKPCSFENDLCDPVSYLACGLHEICDCANREDTIYESDLTCRLLVDSKCTPGLQKCVSNSECVEGSVPGDFKCECETDYVETERRICDRKYLGHGEECSAVPLDLCDRNQFLECNLLTGHCDCKKPPTPTGDVIFDENTGSCYLLERTPCEPDLEAQQCAPNSECLFYNGENVCQCEGQMERNSIGLCFSQYEHSCKMGNDMCDPYEYLVCGFEDKCNCKNASESVFELPDRRCHLLAGANCIPGEQACLDNAECNTISGKCECKAHFHLTETNMCVADTLGFAEECDIINNNKCDANQFLHCDPRTSLCECQFGNSWHDSKTQMCYHLAGSSCGQYNTEQNCVPNAFCNNEGVCQCNDGLTQNQNHFCHVNFQEKCNRTSNTDLCDPLQFLQCSLTGICECGNSDNTWYNSTSGMCEILASGKCQIISVPEAKLQQCVAKAECNENGVCACEGEFKANSANFCTLGHGMNCAEESYGKVFCNPENYLQCTSTNRCNCQNDLYSYHDEETDYCFLREGSPCTLGEQKCGPNSICMKRRGETDFKCTCSDGLTPNVNNRCFLAYNTTCSATHDLCDPDEFMHCGLQQKCNCIHDKSYYNPDSKQCQLLAKSDCFLGKGEQCVENAVCLTTPNGNAVCECSGNFTANDESHCRLSHRVECSPKENLCDSNKFLTCSPYGLCECQNTHETYYDPGTQYCYLSAQSPCNFSENSQKCIQNSHCDPVSLSCQCNTDTWELELSDINHCVLHYSKSCSNDNDLCDKNGFLQCNNENKCGCELPDKSWYNPRTDDCQLRAGVSCTLNYTGAQQCFDHSACKPIGGGGSNQSVCTCDATLSQNKNGICYLKHSQSCELDNNDICDPAAFLSCELTSKKCACNIAGTVFNENKQECERLPGGQCLTEENEPACVDNSSCDAVTKTCLCNEGYEFSKANNSCLKSHEVPCMGNEECNGENHLDCIGQRCICREGYFPLEGEDAQSLTQCLPGYLQFCNDELPCYVDSGLICTADSICQCPRPDQQIFEPDRKKCVGLEGTHCILENLEQSNMTTSNCIFNADCVLGSSLNDTVQGVCQCDEGYNPNPSHLCISGSNANTFTVPVAVFLIIHYVTYQL